MSISASYNNEPAEQEAIDIGLAQKPLWLGRLWDLEPQLEMGSPDVAVADTHETVDPRLEGRGGAVDLQKYQNTLQKAAMASPGKDRSLAKRCNTLACAWGALALQTDKLDNIQDGTDMALKAMDLVPTQNPTRAIFSHNLGVLLCCRFLKTRRISDLEEAVEVAFKAFKRSRQGRDPRIPGLMRLFNELEAITNENLMAREARVSQT